MAPRVAGVGAMLHEEKLREMGLFGLQNKRFWEDPTAEEQPSSALIKMMKPSFSQCGMQEGERKQAKDKTRDVQTGYKEKLFHSMDNQAL